MILEPLYLELENNYNLNVIKELKTASSFFLIDETVRKCKDDLTFDECVTNKYIDELIEKCKCLPLTLRFTNEVNKN